MAEDTEDHVTVTIEPDLFEGKDGTELKPAQNGHDKREEDPSEVLRAQASEARAEADRERQRAATAERQANDARQEATRAREEVTAARSEAVEGQVSAVESGISASQAEADAAESEYKTAFEAGDATKMAKALRAMSSAEANLVRLQEAKADLEVRKARAPEPQRAADRPERQPQRTSDDPVEAYVQGRSEPTAKWLREHKDWVTDPRKNAKLTAAHFDAVGNDLAPDTPEYFEHVETFIGLKTNGKEPAKDTVSVQPHQRRKPAPPAAPVGQSGGGMNGNTGREVTLTRGEAAAATDGTHIWNYDDTSPQKRFRKGDPIGVQEFARRKLEMTKQGQYDRSYVEQ
jgi:hypothetical protein